MSLGWFRLEFRMTLHRHEPGMVRQLDYLNQLTIGTRATELHPMRRELRAVLVVKFVAMPVAFGNQERTIGTRGPAPFRQCEGYCPNRMVPPRCVT